MFAIIDCGTTNTRVFILDDKENIIARSKKKVGVRDSAIAGTNEVLKKGIKETFWNALQKIGASVNDIDFVIASGMITSEIGLIDLPHLWAPVGIKEIAKSVQIIRDTKVFPFDIPVVFIRGIKNNYQTEEIEGIRYIDFMRGEETQMMGLLQRLKPVLPCNVIVLSSHTKLIHINEEGKIEGSITTVSGQIYEAVKSQTFIGKCIEKNDKEEFDNEHFERNLEVILKMAYEAVEKSGFLRTLLMARFMENLLDTKWYERRLFIEAAIAAEDIKIIDEARNKLGFKIDSNIILIGNERRCRIYQKLIEDVKGIENKIDIILDPELIDSFSIYGSIEIAKESRILKFN